MRTIRDLEAAFADLADTAPHPDLLSVPTTSPVRSRRRLLAPAVAAVATAAVVGGVVYATSGSNPKGTPAAGPARSESTSTAPSAAREIALQPPRSPKTQNDSPDLTFRFTADAPAGTTAPAAYSIDRGGQVLKFGATSVTLYYENPAKDPDEAPLTIDKVGHRVDQKVNGHPGFYGRLGGNYTDKSEKLYWEYAPGAWAQASAPDRTSQLTLAESVRGAAPQLLVPVNPSVTRAGQFVNILDCERDNDRGGYEISTPGAEQGGFWIAWSTGSLTNDNGEGEGASPEDVTIAGRSWTITGTTQPAATTTDSGLTIRISGYYGTTRSELEKYIAGLQFAADLTDHGTWFSTADLLR